MVNTKVWSRLKPLGLNPTVVLDSSRLREMMRQRGLSQSALAREVHVSQTTVAKLLAGGQGSKHLHRIARVLGTTPAYLEGELDDPSPDASVHAGLSATEAEFLDLLRAFAPKDREAIMQIARTVAASGQTRMLHTPESEWRGKGRE